jgi:hypothetical protein
LTGPVHEGVLGGDGEVSGLIVAVNITAG